MATNDFGMMVTPSGEVISDLLHGACDMHIHIAPDYSTERVYDAIDTAKEASRLGMKGIVVKSFFYPTLTAALLANKFVPDVKTFGSVTIGEVTTGGLEYAAKTIEVNAKMGCKFVWFPAFDALHCRKALHQEGGIRVLDEDGKLKPEVGDILDVIKEYDMVLASGHMAFDETIAVFREAQKKGIKKLVATHPLVDVWPKFTIEQMQECVKCGAYIEHVYGQMMPRCGSHDPREYVQCVKEIGAEHTVMGTDLSQITDVSPAEGMRLDIAMMLQFGCTEDEVRLMCQTNPSGLLDI